MREKQSDAMLKYMEEQPNTYGEINYMTNNSLEIDPQEGMLSNQGCQEVRSDGPHCKAHPGRDSKCFWHIPQRRGEMLEASRKGGSRRTLELPVNNPLSGEEARGILASVRMRPS